MSTGTQERRMPRGAMEGSGLRMKYLHLKWNSICEESKTPVDGWEKKEIKDDFDRVTAIKYIKPYRGGVEAWINEIIWYSREHEGTPYEGWRFILDAGEQLYSLDFPLQNRATKRMLMTIRNINFQDFVEFQAWTDRESGNIAFNMRQNGQSVPQFYTKADMKDCPPPTKKLIRNKEEWDWEDTDNFLWEQMQNVIAPAVLKIAIDERNWRPLEQQRKEGPAEPTHSGPRGEIHGDAYEPQQSAAAPASSSDKPTRPEGHVRGCKCEPCIAFDKYNDDIPF